MEEKIVRCCDTCSHCDVLDCYCYVHYKDVRLEDVCDEWTEYEG